MKRQVASATLVAGERAADAWPIALVPILAVVAIVFAVAIFIVDAFIAIDMAIAVLYVSVVLMSVSFCSRRGVIAVGAACMLLALLAFTIQHSPMASNDSLGRCVMSLLAIAITTFLAVRIQSTTAALHSQARLLDLTRDAIFVRDTNDIITYWNRGAEQLYGWPSEHAVGRTTRHLIETSFPRSYDEAMVQLLRAGHWEGELVHTKRDGRKVTVESRWSLERDERGQPAFVLETNTDIEARKQAHETLAKAQAELAHVSRVSTLGELAASIAHEVNQPLTAIVTSGEACLRWLARDVPQLEGVQRGVERMIDEGRRASEVVRRLRALSKKGEPRTAPLNVNEVIEDAVSLMQRELAVHRVSLALDLTSSPPAVLGDRVQVQQVIINLLVNAIQAMAPLADRPRKLVVRSRPHEVGEVVVSLCDTGIGFEPAQADQLFNAFYTTKSDGMGMGLSICRSIIEAHGGRIWASRNDEGGATFRFALPQHVETLS